MGTGVARLDLETGHTVVKTLHTEKLRGHKRLEVIQEEIAEVARGVNVAGVEGFSYGSKTSSAEWIYANGIMVRHLLWRRRIPFAVISPSNVKLYVTGNGGADKTDVVREVQRSFPRVLIQDDNQADALTIACMIARRHLRPVDAHRLRYEHALEKCEWPDHEGEPRRLPTPKNRPKFKASPLDY